MAAAQEKDGSVKIEGMVFEDKDGGGMLELTFYVPHKSVQGHSEIDADTALKANITRFLRHLDLEAVQGNLAILGPQEKTNQWLAQKQAATRSGRLNQARKEQIDMLQTWALERILKEHSTSEAPDEETIRQWSSAIKLWAYERIAEDAKSSAVPSVRDRPRESIAAKQKEKLLERHSQAETDNAQALYSESGLRSLTHKLCDYLHSMGCPASFVTASGDEEGKDMDRLIFTANIRDAPKPLLQLARAMSENGSLIQIDPLETIANKAGMPLAELSPQDSSRYYHDLIQGIEKRIFSYNRPDMASPAR